VVACQSILRTRFDPRRAGTRILADFVRASCRSPGKPRFPQAGNTGPRFLARQPGLETAPVDRQTSGGGKLRPGLEAPGPGVAEWSHGWPRRAFARNWAVSPSRFGPWQRPHPRSRQRRLSLTSDRGSERPRSRSWTCSRELDGKAEGDPCLACEECSGRDDRDRSAEWHRCCGLTLPRRWERNRHGG
jgi:hypothetical protein